MTAILKVTDLDHSHYLRLRMTANVPAGTTLEQVTNPGYWANHAFRLKPGTLIEVLSEDNVLDCELRVLEVAPTYAKVRVLRNYVETAENKAPVAAPDDIIVDFAGKVDKWRVLQGMTVISSGLATKDAAEKAAEEYRSKFAA